MLCLQKKVKVIMKIKILGTRGKIPLSSAYHSRHSAILIDDKLLFDLGEYEFLDYRPRAIFITHLHPDHAYFVRRNQNFPEIDVPIYAPERYKKSTIRILSSKIKIDGYTIMPIPTEHSLKVKSQAYVISRGNECILYTGDMFWIKKRYHKFLQSLDIVFADGSFINEGGMIRRDRTTKEPYGHAGIPNIIRFFKPYTNHIVFIHFGSWFFNKGAGNARKLLYHLGKKFGIKVTVGYDGMTIVTKKCKP